MIDEIHSENSSTNLKTFDTKVKSASEKIPKFKKSSNNSLQVSIIIKWNFYET